MSAGMGHVSGTLKRVDFPIVKEPSLDSDVHKQGHMTRGHSVET